MKTVLCIAVLVLSCGTAQSAIGSIYVHGTNPISITTDPTAGFGYLYVTVLDTNHNYVQNATVTFSAPTSGPGATFPNPTGTTDTQGVAGGAPLGNGVAGNYR